MNEDCLGFKTCCSLPVLGDHWVTISFYLNEYY